MNARLASAPATRTARFAVLFTGAVVLTAWFLASVVQLSEQAVVLPIIVVAFVASWVVTGRPAPTSHHRATVIPVRTRAH
jgi:hypothetical protein